MNLYNISILAYSILLIIGGYMGHQAGSTVSLITSVASGLSLLILLGLSLNNSGWPVFAINGLITVLALFFAYRWFTTGKFMPGGLLLIISAAVLFIALLFKTKIAP